MNDVRPEAQTASLEPAEALRESEARYRSLLEHGPDAIFVSLGDRVALANGACARLFGAASADELLGRSPFDLFPPDQHDTLREQLRQIRTGGGVPTREARVLRLDGSRVDVEVWAAPFPQGAATAIHVILRDISERRHAEARVQASVRRLERAVNGTVRAVSVMSEVRDPYTAGHERRVGDLAAAIGARLGLDGDALQGLRMTGYVHDVGKISIPSEFLSKPGRLTVAEFAMIKTHAEQGYRILRDAELPWQVADAVWQHHERLDGSGYPRGLRGDEILLEARIIGVADVVEAMASDRPYRPGLGVEAALAEIEQNAGRLYDPAVAEACLALFRHEGYRFSRDFAHGETRVDGTAARARRGSG